MMAMESERGEGGGGGGGGSYQEEQWGGSGIPDDGYGEDPTGIYGKVEIMHMIGRGGGSSSFWCGHL